MHMHIEKDKIYARAFREKRSRGEKKEAHAWGCLAPGGAGSSDTKKGKSPNPGQYPEPQFKLGQILDDFGSSILLGGRGLCFAAEKVRGGSSFRGLAEESKQITVCTEIGDSPATAGVGNYLMVYHN